MASEWVTEKGERAEFFGNSGSTWKVVAAVALVFVGKWATSQNLSSVQLAGICHYVPFPRSTRPHAAEGRCLFAPLASPTISTTSFMIVPYQFDAQT